MKKLKTFIHCLLPKLKHIKFSDKENREEVKVNLDASELKVS